MSAHNLKNKDDPVIDTLLESGVPVSNIWTNGYSYSFNFNIFLIEFVNQEHRIAGRIINISRPMEEISFVFSGAVKGNVKNLMKLLNLPDEKRKLLGTDIYLEEDNFDVLVTPEKSITQFSSYRIHQDLLFLPSIIKRIVLELSNWFKNGKCEHKNMKLRKTFGFNFTSVNTWLNIYEYCEVCGHTEFKYQKR